MLFIKEIVISGFPQTPKEGKDILDGSLRVIGVN